MPVFDELVPSHPHAASAGVESVPRAGGGPADEPDPGPSCVGLAAGYRATVAAWVDGDPERALMLRRYFVERRPLDELGADAAAALDQFIHVFGREHRPRGGADVLLEVQARIDRGLFPPPVPADSVPSASAQAAGGGGPDRRAGCPNTTLVQTTRFHPISRSRSRS